MESLKPVTVLHVGVGGDGASGMAQVVNGYLSWAVPGFRMRGLTSVRYRRDPLSPLLWIRAMMVIVRQIPRRPFTVVAVHLSERGSFLREGSLLCAAHALGLATVAHLHGAHLASFHDRHPRMVAAVLRRAGGVAALTNEALEIARRYAPIPANVRMVRNPVDLPAEAPHLKERRILFGGEVSRRKGADTLAAAWTEVSATYPEWTLDVAGPDVEGLASRLKELPGVVYHGSVPHERLLELASRSAVAVLPSRAEALPMFLLEAMANSNAVISTSVGDIPALVTPGCGQLVEAGDANQLAAAVTSYMASPDLAREHGRAARARVNEVAAVDAVQRELTAVWLAALQAEEPDS